MSSRHIICMKWGTKYDAEYVNRLYRMVKRHMTLPATFICLTDSTRGIDPAIQCFDLPPLELPNDAPERGWNKLSTFEPDLYGLKGQALFLDLDVVIVDNIDSLFTYQPTLPFVVIHDWKRPWRITGNTSVYRFNIGAFPDVLSHFRMHFEAIRTQFRNEQAFLCHYLKNTYNALHYWPTSWCKSYKYHCVKPLPFSLWQTPQCPNNSRIIVFHGEVNPPDAIKGGGGKWYRHILPAPWIKAHWQ